MLKLAQTNQQTNRQGKNNMSPTTIFAHLIGFHDDWAKNVISRVHVIQLTGTIFKLNSHIKETNVLTKFHENWAKNVTSRVFTCFHYIHIEKNAPPTDINKTNVLNNFHDDWANIVTSRVFTRKTAPPPGSHETKVLTKFHENWAKNVTSRVEKCPAHWRPYINKTNVLTNFHDDWAKIVTSRVFTRKTAPPTGGHVFQRTGTTFKLNQHIIKANILTNVYKFLTQHIIGTNLLTKFHEDRT
ncbi:hypothetical protein DPMN_120839 [Dreissena polymorpha]|uniref:Uncharacterized protein n=1 Tax=Dreissena polymorpha TaxID=45954 RepID=A0A9D4GKJ3_DREPO|nr:hypothetical protein DPMN_120839 [Dreissena polymorpha]